MNPENNLRAWRERRGWTIGEMAEALSTTPATISRIETRLQQPRLELLQRICDLFGVSPGDFYARSNVSASDIGRRRIPVLNFLQAANFRDLTPFAPEKEEKTEFVTTTEDYSPDTFALVIEGDSMEPEFKPGDKVIIDPSISPRPGDFVAAKDLTKGDVTFKRFRPRGVSDSGQEYFTLEPLNTDYPSMRSDFQNIEIIGTMMEHTRFRKR